MNFDNEKKQALAKIDHSKKGSIDKQIKELIEKINSMDNYYTTSSCAGRIMLLTQGNKKDSADWLFSSHDQVSYEDISEALKNLPDNTVWFKMESPILHIACRDLGDADLLLKTANNNGFRRSALLSFSNRIIAEILITERIEMPISDKGKLLANEDCLRFLIKEANSKLKRSRSKLKKFEEIISSPALQEAQRT